jgi:uncharacterized membrane protein
VRRSPAPIASCGCFTQNLRRSTSCASCHAALPDGRHHEEAGEVRLVVRVPKWEDYVELATEELTLPGAGSPRIVRRLRRALEDLRELAPAEASGDHRATAPAA